MVVNSRQGFNLIPGRTSKVKKTFEGMSDRSTCYLRPYHVRQQSTKRPEWCRRVQWNLRRQGREGREKLAGSVFQVLTWKTILSKGETTQNPMRENYV